MCGVSLKDKKQSEDFYSHLGIQSVADVVRHGRLRWFGHLEQKIEELKMIGCRSAEKMEVVVGMKCEGKERKTWGECVRKTMELPSMEHEWAIFRDV